MAITQSYVFTRPDTNNSFHNDTTSDIVSQFKTSREGYITSGKLSVTQTDSDDGLTRTVVATFADLITFADRDNYITIEFDNDFYWYTNAHNHQITSYTLSGIDAAFTCITTYTFPSASLPIHDALVIGINNQSTNNKLKNLVVEETVITVTHQYDNATDFSENFWKDFTLTPDLHAAGVTRTIAYAMV